MNVEAWSDARAREVSAWHYEPPYDFYDLASDPRDAEEMRANAMRGHFRAITGQDGRLEAFWYFDWHDDCVEVGLGVRPDLTGRGLGGQYVQAELDYARQEWAPSRFRLWVAAWNERAIRLYERHGFVEVDRETRSFELVGEHEFVRMERDA